MDISSNESLKSALEGGHYARKQIFCKSRIISWTHSRRFRIGLELAQQLSGNRVLDYGCGDGTFLAMLLAQQRAPAEAVGVEIAPDLIEDCRTRLGGDSRLSFALVNELNPSDRFETIFCMEVLEHVVDLPEVLQLLDLQLAPAGCLLISVPVEMGIPLLIKQAVRKVAGWRGIGDYPGNSPYSAREYITSVFAGAKQHIERPVYDNADGSQYHDHKGFNWMRLKSMLAERFILEQVLSSPVQWLSPHLASQVWFVMRKKG